MAAVTSDQPVIWTTFAAHQLLAHIIGWPLLQIVYAVVWISRKIQGPSHGLFSSANYVFELRNPWDRLLKAWLLDSVRVGSTISGVTSLREAWGELAISDTISFFVGYQLKEGKTFGVRGTPEADGAIPVDILWMNSLVQVGRFAVFESDLKDAKYSKVTCVWVSGPHSGFKF
jgi:hypothetical protein